MALCRRRDAQRDGPGRRGGSTGHWVIQEELNPVGVMAVELRFVSSSSQERLGEN